MNYVKRDFVMQLTLFDGTEYLIQAVSEEDMQLWIRCIRSAARAREFFFFFFAWFCFVWFGFVLVLFFLKTSERVIACFLLYVVWLFVLFLYFLFFFFKEIF